MADEINRACDDGRLPAWPRRSGLLPVWRSEQAGELTRTFFSFFDFVISFHSFSAVPPLSIGDDNDLQLFRDLTRDHLSVSERATNLRVPNQEAADLSKFTQLQDIGKTLRPVLLVMFFVTGLIALVRIAQAVIRRQPTFPLVLAFAAFGGLVAYVLVNALVQVTSFPVTAVSTFGPVYPLLLIFMIAVIWDAAAAWLPRPPAPAAPAA